MNDILNNNGSFISELEKLKVPKYEEGIALWSFDCEKKYKSVTDPEITNNDSYWIVSKTKSNLIYITNKDIDDIDFNYARIVFDNFYRRGEEGSENIQFELIIETLDEIRKNVNDIPSICLYSLTVSPY